MLRPLFRKLQSKTTRLFSSSKPTNCENFSTTLEFSPENKIIETFALTSKSGNLLPGQEINSSEKETLKTIYRIIDEMEVIDDFMNKAQRQGLVLLYFDFFF